ncbi:hypothetical protein PJI17_02285 [Mycobacterium kansasii]|nr:transcriptional regulator, TetR family [Mycobacterium avium MAV_120709_2344]
MSLHRHFHDAMFEQVRSVATTLPAGPDRLNRMATVYLDYCLENHGVRALILEARGSLAIQDEVRARSKLSAAFVATDFAAMGWPEPQRAADLWVAAAGECALIELEAGGPDLATRRTLQYAFTLPRQE